MTRNNQPINEVKLSKEIDFDIGYNNLFRDMKSIIHANGTINDIKDWWYGNLDKEVLKLIQHFYMADTLLEAHKNDVLALEHKNSLNSKD